MKICLAFVFIIYFGAMSMIMYTDACMFHSAISLIGVNLARHNNNITLIQFCTMAEYLQFHL